MGTHLQLQLAQTRRSYSFSRNSSGQASKLLQDLAGELLFTFGSAKFRDSGAHASASDFR